MKNKSPEIQVLSGTIRKLKVENTTAEVFFQAGDRESMAATGTAAAAMGLSGIAAGMALMSTDEAREPVCKVNFDLDGRKIEALLWNWPFKEGDQVQVVNEVSEFSQTTFAVIDPKDKIVVLYPHVTAGRSAHWRNVLKWSILVGVIASLISSLMMIFGVFAIGGSVSGKLLPLFGGFVSVVIAVAFIGYRIGRRFTPFTKMAEKIFSALGWKDVSNINLRKLTKAKRKPADPPAMGDSYFRY